MDKEMLDFFEKLNQEFANKILRGIFDSVRKNICYLPDPDEQFQEGLASVWKEYRDAAKRGKVIPDNMLIWMLKRRVRDMKRRFTGGRGQRRDPMGMIAIRCDGIDTECFSEFDEDLEVVFATEDLIISEIELRGWIDSLDGNDRVILISKYKNRKSLEIARELGVTMQQVNERAKVLGQMLADRMGVTINSHP